MSDCGVALISSEFRPPRSRRHECRRRDRDRSHSRPHSIVSRSCSTTNHGVADIAQFEQRVEQLVVVALMQADRWFVENIQHAHQSRSDLGRQSDSLSFAAGESRRRATEGQVIKPDIAQEPEPFADFLENLTGDSSAVAASA